MAYTPWNPFPDTQGISDWLSKLSPGAQFIYSPQDSNAPGTQNTFQQLNPESAGDSFSGNPYIGSPFTFGGSNPWQNRNPLTLLGGGVGTLDDLNKILGTTYQGLTLPTSSPDTGMGLQKYSPQDVQYQNLLHGGFFPLDPSYLSTANGTNFGGNLHNLGNTLGVTTANGSMPYEQVLQLQNPDGKVVTGSDGKRYWQLGSNWQDAGLAKNFSFGDFLTKVAAPFFGAGALGAGSGLFGDAASAGIANPGFAGAGGDIFAGGGFGDAVGAVSPAGGAGAGAAGNAFNLNLPNEANFGLGGQAQIAGQGFTGGAANALGAVGPTGLPLGAATAGALGGLTSAPTFLQNLLGNFNLPGGTGTGTGASPLGGATSSPSGLGGLLQSLGINPSLGTLLGGALGAFAGSQTQPNINPNLPDWLNGILYNQSQAASQASNPNYRAALTQQGQTISGQNLDPRNNPAVQGQLQALTDQFTSQTVPNASGGFYKQNMSGPLFDSSAFANPNAGPAGAPNSIMGILSENLGRGYGQSVSQGYQTERAAQENAARIAGVQSPFGFTQQYANTAFQKPIFTTSPGAGAIFGGLGGLTAANNLFNPSSQRSPFG